MIDHLILILLLVVIVILFWLGRSYATINTTEQWQKEIADSYPHWISVEDKEPPKGQWIITYEPTSPIVIGTDIILSDETADEHHITHWMPLPSVEHLKEKKAW